MSRISIFNRQSIVEFYYERVKLKATNKTDYVLEKYVCMINMISKYQLVV